MGWEAVIDDLHALYEGAGLASIVKNPAPMKPVGKAKKGVFPAVYLGEGPPDYTVVCKGGCYILDAKDHAGTRWPLDKLPDHQAARFGAHTRQGGWAGVLLRLPAGIWLLPWERRAGSGLRPAWERWRAGAAAHGDASLTPAACDAMGMRLRSADWLTAASILFAEVPLTRPG